MTRPRVLVVDDRPGVLDVMAAVLERGYDVVTSRDGASALALIAERPPDVVLTDVRMPGASGFDLLRAVRERAPSTAVVMITAYANVSDAVVSMQLGAFDYVAKPLEADEIALVVARAVEHARRSPPPAAPPDDEEGERAEVVPLEPLSGGFRRAVEAARARASREYLVRLMAVHHGNVTYAARSAALTRESLHRVLRKFAVRPEDHRDDPGGGGDPGTAGDDVEG